MLTQKFIFKIFGFYTATYRCYFCGHSFNTLHASKELAKIYAEEEAPLLCKKCGMVASWRIN